MLILDSVRADLSWLTVLSKREKYRAAVDDFDSERTNRYDAAKVADLPAKFRIVRNRLKSAAAVRDTQGCLIIHEQLFNNS